MVQTRIDTPNSVLKLDLNSFSLEDIEFVFQPWKVIDTFDTSLSNAHQIHAYFFSTSHHKKRQSLTIRFDDLKDCGLPDWEHTDAEMSKWFYEQIFMKHLKTCLLAN